MAGLWGRFSSYISSNYASDREDTYGGLTAETQTVAQKSEGNNGDAQGGIGDCKPEELGLNIEGFGEYEHKEEEDLDGELVNSSAIMELEDQDPSEVDEVDLADIDEVDRWLANEASDEWQRVQPKYTLLRYGSKYASFSLIK